MVTLRGQTDDYLQALKQALNHYETVHANTGAEATVYRQNPGSIRIRIIDRRFEGMSRGRRHDEVWDFLADRVSDDTMSEVSVLLLLAPAELGSSMMNMEFDDPVKSDL